ncbi:MAG: hypothetical protein L3J54_00940 [Draconibacterium sp.]|nr:hypothetical protein [Draconibacterium sp.]
MRVLVMFVLVMSFMSCVRNKNTQNIQNAMPDDSKAFEVTEVIQATSYSYLKVKENFGERWVAVSKQDIKVGDVYYYNDALQMTNFKSKDLDRTFDVIYFVSQISKTPLNKASKMPMTQNSMGMQQQHTGKVETKKESTITLKKPVNEITLAKVFENREKYSAEEFKIRGVVVKVNKEVMGRNWIHIQDGTSNNGIFDLTITTQEIAKVGDEVVFKGKLTLNKDFGAGYFYEVIMEDAVLLSKKQADVKL